MPGVSSYVSGVSECPRSECDWPGPGEDTLYCPGLRRPQPGTQTIEAGPDKDRGLGRHLPTSSQDCDGEKVWSGDMNGFLE